jgi:peptidyl-prolyl cis-trans isomerase SurA
MKPLFLSVLSLSLAAGPAHAVIFERIIAKVNGEIITLSDLENRQMAAVQAAGISGDRIPAFLREQGGRILQETIDEMLVYQKGEEMGIAERVTPEYLDNVVKDIKKENNIENDEVFKAQLAREGLTLEGLRRNIKRSLVRQQVVHQLVENKIAVNEAELREEYNRHRSDFTKPAQVKLQEIVLKPDTPANRTQADDLVRRARSGEDFAGLARQFSTSATRSAGGDLGAVTVSEMQPDMRKALASLEAGQVTDPVVLGGTVRILKLNERTEARTVPYEEAREELTRRLKKDRMEKEYATLVADLRKDSVIEQRVREAPVTTDVQVPTEPMLREPAVSAPLPEGALAAPSTAGADEVVVSPQDRPKIMGPGDTVVSPTGTPTPLPPATPAR